MQTLVEIPIKKIIQRENSRVGYNETHMEELMISMRQSGLLQPVGVVKDSDGFELMFGNRRYVAAKKLGWTKIPALVFDRTGDNKGETDILIKNAVENVQRQDVPFAQQGRIYDILLKQGLSVGEIAARVAVPKKRVQQTLDLFYAVPKAVQEQIASPHAGAAGKSKKGKIPASSAYQILNLSKTCKLTSDQTKELYQRAKDDEFRNRNINAIAKLLKIGVEYEDALAISDNVKTVGLTIMVDAKDYERLQKNTGIHEYFYDLIAKNSAVKIIAGKSKKLTRAFIRD